MNKTILISGGKGSLASQLVAQNTGYNIVALGRKEMDVTDINEIESVIITHKPDYFIHAAALTRPMIEHITSPDSSIQSNIIGTSNVVLMCIKHNIKLVYISTDYVYPGTDGNYSETDPVYPVNEYAWSKLGGECAVQLYKNSLILRLCMAHIPYPHELALADIFKSYISTGESAQIILKLLDEQGIINIGGIKQTPYEFVKQFNKNIGKIFLKDIKDVDMARDASLNIDKLNKLI